MMVTKGDANNTADEPIAYDSITGKVVGRIKGFGKAIDFLRSPIVVILILGSAVLLMEYSFKKEKSNKNDEINKKKKKLRNLKIKKQIKNSC